MGAEAVRAILDDSPSVLIGEERGAIVRVPLKSVADQGRLLDPSLIELVDKLSV